MDSIKLEKIEKKENKVIYSFIVSSNIKKYFNEEKFFIEYDTNIEDIPDSILAIPFVSVMLPIIWCTNSILWIYDIDKTFYESIFRIKNAYQEMYPHFKLKGTVVAVKVINNYYDYKNEAIQLFSGGVDAHTTFIRIKEKNPILINIYGWNKNIDESNIVFEQDKKDIREFANKNNLNSKFIKSNFATFIDTKKFDYIYSKKIGRSLWFGFQHSMAFISISIPLAFKYKVRNIYIASSNTIGYRTACASDPTTDIEFKYSTVGGTIHDGFELNRQDKIRVISDYQRQINKNYPIRVCSFNDKNCCECEKCFRTILGLVAEGAELKKFDFFIDGNIKEHFVKLMNKRIHLLGLEKENEIYWDDIKNRMIENKENILEKEFMEWFLNYDFLKERKRAVIKYRVKNFPILIKKKILKR